MPSECNNLSKPRVDIEQFKVELQNVINRYNQETDLTITDLLGVMELIKAQYIEVTFNL